MPSDPQTPAVLIVTGVPGAGKTTVSEIVSRNLSRSALIHGDQIHNLVVSGRLHPQEEPAAEADQQLRLRDVNMAVLADNLVGTGFSTVIDDVFVYRARLRRFLSFLRARPVYLAVLNPSLDVVRFRDANRPEKTVFHIWSYLHAVMHQEIAGLGLWIDSSLQSPEETASQIVRDVWDEGLLGQL